MHSDSADPFDGVRVRGRRRPALAAILILTFFAIAVRLPFALAAPVYCDEAATYTWYCVGEASPFWYALRNYPAPNNHVLHTLLVTTIYSMFDCGYPWLRLPAFVAGVACIPFGFFVMKRLIGRRRAIITAAILSVSAMAVHFSIEARGYMPAMLLGLAAVHLAFLSRRNGSRLTMVIAGIAAGLAVFTIPTAVHLVAGLAVWLLLDALLDGNNGSGARLLRAADALLFSLTAGAIALLLYAPMVSYTGVSTMTRCDSLHPLSASELPAALRFGFLDIGAMLTGGPWPAVLILLSAILGVADLAGRRPRTALLFVSLLVTPILLSVVLRRIPPSRTVTFLLPYALACAACGIDRILRPPAFVRCAVPRLRRSVTFMALVALAASTLAHYAAGWPFTRPRASDVRPLLPTVREQLHGGAFVFAGPGVAETLRYYLAEAGEDYLRVGLPRKWDRLDQLVSVESRSYGLSEAVVEALAKHSHEKLLFETDQFEVWRMAPEARPVNRRVTLRHPMPAETGHRVN